MCVLHEIEQGPSEHELELVQKHTSRASVRVGEDSRGDTRPPENTQVKAEGRENKQRAQLGQEAQYQSPVQPYLHLGSDRAEDHARDDSGRSLAEREHTCHIVGERGEQIAPAVINVLDRGGDFRTPKREDASLVDALPLRFLNRRHRSGPDTPHPFID